VSKPEIVPHDVIDEALRNLAWDRQGDEITCDRSFPTFREALGFVTAVGALAEQQDHHPNIDLRYTAVHLALSTHEVAGLTERDLAFARAVDQIFR